MSVPAINEVVLTFAVVELDDEGYPYPVTQVYRIEFEGSVDDFLDRITEADVPGSGKRIVGATQMVDRV